jgi:Na+:H+ antiporter, NhaC family
MQKTKEPTLWHAFIPIIFLIVLLSLNVVIFGDAALDGSNQIVLILAAAVAAIVSSRLGISWDDMIDGVVKSISSAMSSILILLLIGALAGTWLLSGIVPAMIYYGLQILNPAIFLFAACVVSAIVSLATGSSWSTIATLGVALLGIGQALGISEGLVAGAIISAIRCRRFPTRLTSPLRWPALICLPTSGTWFIPPFLRSHLLCLFT